MSPKSKKILLGVTGSIAAYKSGDIIRRLQEKGYEVAVMMTKESEQFITSLTLSALTGGRVFRDMFGENKGVWDMQHIALAQETDVLLIAPATANIIGKIASGIADDLLTCTAMATRAKILIAPAMNDQMYKNPIVQDNCQKLKKAGVAFIEPKEGKLACGTTGIGHLAEVDDIVKAVDQAFER